MDNYADRAKQFLPFAALTGFERCLAEREAALETEAQQTQREKFSEFPEFIEKNNADSC